MSDLTLYVGGDSWEDRNDSEERMACHHCGISISALELGVFWQNGVAAHADCQDDADRLQRQREHTNEEDNDSN